MRILFAGTPEIAVPSLQLLASSSHEVVGVLTAPDRRAGRGRGLQPGPVKALAVEHAIPVIQPERLGAAARDQVRPLNPDLLACVAYGRIFGPKFLGVFELGGINLHPSLLPRFRGPAPIPAAILAGDSVTGVTVQQLALEMDAGDILAQAEIPLDGSETAGALSEIAADLGARLMLDVVDGIDSGTVKPRPQDPAGVTHTRLLQKEDGRIDWKRPAVEISRAVRAYHPWPLAFTTFNGQRLNILTATPVAHTGPVNHGLPGTVLRVDNAHGILIETGDGLLAVTELQLQARKALSWKNFLNGVTDFVGAVLGG